MVFVFHLCTAMNEETKNRHGAINRPYLRAVVLPVALVGSPVSPLTTVTRSAVRGTNHQSTTCSCTDVGVGSIPKLLRSWHERRTFDPPREVTTVAYQMFVRATNSAMFARLNYLRCGKRSTNPNGVIPPVTCVRVFVYPTELLGIY